MNKPILKRLCKLRGALVLFEVSKCAEGETGRCPVCGGKSFTKNGDWLDCECGWFSMLNNHHDEIKQ